MKTRYLLFLLLIILNYTGNAQSKIAPKRYLYVAVPGIRDYLGYGGHGILVFDINNNHKFLRRIKTQGFHPDKSPSNVKGIAVSIPLNSIYLTTLESLQRIDLTTEKIIWEKIPLKNLTALVEISKTSHE